MKYSLIILSGLLLLIPARVKSQPRASAINLTDSSSISLLTISPGRELYTRFGHSAIRVHDPNLSIDVVFNYGTFNFDTPGFYVKFLRGKLLYFVNAYGYDLMHHEYMQLNQSMFEQTLNLTLQEKQEVFNFLIENNRPENRYYLYDFFMDNCSSRIRDVFKNILQDRLEFKETNEGRDSFRGLVHVCLAMAPWEKYGVDLVLGLPADAMVTPWNRMFLPGELMTGFGLASVRHDSITQPFAMPAKTLYAEIPVKEVTGFFTPTRVFTGILILVFLITGFQARKPPYRASVDIILFGLSGLLGLAILFMWFGTDHLETKNNLNILWAMPLNIIVPFMLIKNRHHPFLKWYLIFNTLLNIILLFGWNAMPQRFNNADIPVVLIFISRGVYLLLVNHRWPISIQPKPIDHVD